MIKLIWCEDKNQGISKNQKLPWNIPEELNHFKKTTLNQVVVMGYNTFLSIGNPLPNRTNIVLTKKHKNQLSENIFVYSDLKKVFHDFANTDIYVIGGKKVYEQALYYANELIVSRLNKSYKCDLFLKLNLESFDLKKVDKFDEFQVSYYVRKKTDNKNSKEETLDEIDNIFNLKFENFSGPFDLLLNLIHEKKMDIMNLNLADLTDQYLQFIKKNINSVEIEQITDYLVMATYLIELKSKKIIPEDDSEIDLNIEDDKERDRLVKRLIEYKRYRETLPKLEQMQITRFGMFAKEQDDWKDFESKAEEIPEAPLPDFINTSKLYQAMQRVFLRFKNKNILEQKIIVQELSVEEVQEEVYQIIKNSKTKRISLTRILNQVDRLKVNDMYFVTCFVALLVLTRYQKIDLFQHKDNDEIYAELTDPKRAEELQESAEEMIKRQEDFKRETEEYRKEIMKRRSEEYSRKREEYLKEKYGDAYVSREDFLKMTPEEQEKLKAKQALINNKQKHDNKDKNKIEKSNFDKVKD